VIAIGSVPQLVRSAMYAGYLKLLEAKKVPADGT
jgi:hypothetical protein